ncbi:Stf0 family sulfotransferase [Vreelandella aquamarina]|uniref:Stf0 family sulfotransferase n=1 Tax=Vreelandella aquamarina TaxID=77097 RepID=UPI000B7D480E
MNNFYAKQFGEDLNFPSFDNVEDVRCLVICSTPRCGSHMLGHSLYETGKAGFPLEYLQKNNLKRWSDVLGEKNL